MRIGIDISSAKDEFAGRAIGNYTRNIVRNLQKLSPDHEYVLFDKYYPWRFLRSTAFNLFIAPKVSDEDLDVFFQPNFNAGLPVEVCPTVVMMHDVIPLARNKFSQKGFVADKIKKAFYRRDLGYVEAARAVVTNSHFTKSDLVKYTNLDEDRITVTHLGIDEQFRVDRNELEGAEKKDYILYLGGVEENKNIARLIEAFALLKDRSDSSSRVGNIKLILAGGQFVNKSKLETQRLLKLINDLDLGDYIEMPGYVPQEDLPLLYSRALVFVYPSLYEGFGLPPVEAMACGTPVVVSNTTSMPEVCGEAAVYINPGKVESIEQSIRNVINLYGTGEYKQLVAKGRDWANQYSWEQCARETLEVLEQVGKK